MSTFNLFIFQCYTNSADRKLYVFLSIIWNLTVFRLSRIPPHNLAYGIGKLVMHNSIYDFQMLKLYIQSTFQIDYLHRHHIEKIMPNIFNIKFNVFYFNVFRNNFQITFHFFILNLFEKNFLLIMFEFQISHIHPKLKSIRYENC